MSSDLADSTARVQQAIHEAAGWEHSVLLIIRPAVPEAAVVHVDEGGRVWGGATRSPAQIERLRRAAEAVHADVERDISGVVEAFDASRNGATMHELMGSHVKLSGERTDAAVAVFLVRDPDADASMTARWKDGRTVFVEEPLGHTDALLVDAAAYADEPLLETRGSKSSVRLSSRTLAGGEVSGPSALTRYLRLELPELVPWVEPFDNRLAQQDPPVEAAAWLWARIAAAIEISVDQDETGVVRDALDDLAEDQEDYWPDEDSYDREGNPIPAIIGSLIGGAWEDMQAEDPEPRLEELLNAAANTAISINRASPRWGLAYDASATHIALASFMSWYEDPRAAIGLAMALPEVQRLWWLGECLHRKGIALSANSAPRFPATRWNACASFAAWRPTSPLSRPPPSSPSTCRCAPTAG